MAILIVGMLFLQPRDILTGFILGSKLQTLTQASSAKLPSYPLAVKSPYLSAWLPGSRAIDPPTAQPEFWNGIPLTWPILARVNGQIYVLFGNPDPISNAAAAQPAFVSYSSSHTYFQLIAGPANISLDFLSPVLPGKDEYAQQSLPYSYLTVSASISGSDPVDVQILSGIDQTWTAQNGAAGLNYTTTESSGFFWFNNPNAIPFTEVNGQAPYGSVVYGAANDQSTTHSCNSTIHVFDTFARTGSLNSSDSGSPCGGHDLAAISQDLGQVGSDARNVTFIVGFEREEVVNYLGQTQTGYHRTQWPTIPEQVDYVLQSYDAILTKSLAFDADVRSRAEGVSASFGGQYADIVEASVRQVFGGMEITVCIDTAYFLLLLCLTAF